MQQAHAISDLERQQIALAQTRGSDFRAEALGHLVAARLQEGTVVDIGCGAGDLVAWLGERGYDVRGIDVSEPIVRAAREHLRDRGLNPSWIEQSSIESVIERGELADNVVSMECLEHIEDDASAFDSLVAAVRPGGRLILSVPAMPSLFGPKDVAVGHHRRYTAGQLRALADRPDLRVEELRHWNLLGVAPTFVAVRFLKRAVNDSFRFGAPGLGNRILRRGLSPWFRHVENRIVPPLGLTLIMVATVLPQEELP
jgi:SAM-dependent methyltransferase